MDRFLTRRAARHSPTRNHSVAWSRRSQHALDERKARPVLSTPPVPLQKPSRSPLSSLLRALQRGASAFIVEMRSPWQFRRRQAAALTKRIIANRTGPEVRGQHHITAQAKNNSLSRVDMRLRFGTFAAHGVLQDVAEKLSPQSCTRWMHRKSKAGCRNQAWISTRRRPGLWRLHRQGDRHLCQDR